MKGPSIESLEDMVPHIQEHLLPQIQEAVEICFNCFWMDSVFNDEWTFGTQFWKNTWNRFKAVAEDPDACPFEICGKGNEYKLRLGPYVLRHHRISTQSKIPNGAKAVKAAAHQQMCLFSEDWGAPVEKENIVIAIDVDVYKGLKEVFLGEIMPLELNSKKYKWVKKFPVFLVEGADASSSDVFNIVDMCAFKHYPPEEDIIEVPVTLDKSNDRPKGVKSEGDR